MPLANSLGGSTGGTIDGAVPIEHVSIGAIRADAGAQPRAEIDRFTVAEYAANLSDGAVFPPVVLFFDGSTYFLVDGFHRLHAHRQAGCKTIRANVHHGTQSDARWFGLAANRDQDRVGLRRTRADKERAVRAALQHPKAKLLSDNEIAEHVGVDHKTVARHRAILGNSQDAPVTRTVSRRGKTYKMNIGKIGKRKTKARAKTPPKTPAMENGDVDDAAPPDPEDLASKDATGRLIEDAHVRSAFAEVKKFRELADAVTQIKRQAHELAKSAGGAYLDDNDIDDECNRLRSLFVQAIPHALCRSCGGTGCRDCRQSGYHSKHNYDVAVPEEMKK